MSAHRHGAVFLQLNFAVVSGNTHQRLQADVEGVNAVQHADRVDVVAEMPPGVQHGNLVQKHFARMRKRRMPDVMPQGNRLN